MTVNAMTANRCRLPRRSTAQRLLDKIDRRDRRRRYDAAAPVQHSHGLRRRAPRSTRTVVFVLLV